jgi:glycosyltransferase involved in cell wall biosynthesis
MNVLYHHRTRFTGIERVHIMGMVTGLQSLGHRVTVIGPPGTDIEQEAGSSPTRKGNGLAPLWRLISERAPEVLFECFEILYNLYSLINLLLHLRSEKTDMIYERYALFQCGGVLAAAVGNIPIVLEVNDSALIERTRSLRGRKMAAWFERRILRGADLIVTISSRFKEIIASSGIDDGKIQVLPNAIDPETLSPREGRGRDVRALYHLDGRMIIGFVGFFVPWHGLLFLLEVFARLSARHDHVHLLLVGDGPERASLDAAIRQLDLTRRVTMTGYVSHDQVADYLEVFDVAVMPDSNEHGSPMKIFEYLGMAKPVVAPRYAPIEEVLNDGETALLFPPGDADGLYLALETLIEDGELRSRLGARGRESVLAGHTWRHNALEVERGLVRVRRGDR